MSVVQQTLAALKVARLGSLNETDCSSENFGGYVMLTTDRGDGALAVIGHIHL